MVSSIRNDEHIIAIATVHVVSAISTRDRVIACASIESVIDRTTNKRVGIVRSGCVDRHGG